MSDTPTPPAPVPIGSESPTHQRRKAERPDELLDAALGLFVEKGFAATRIDEVARRAGVSKGTLYLYCASKEELLKAVIRSKLSTPIAQAEQIIAAHKGSCASLLRDEVAPWWAAVVCSEASAVFKLIVTEARNFPEIAEFYQREVVLPGSALMSEVLRRGIASGEFRAVDAELAVPSIILPFIMLCIHRHSVGACELLDARQLEPLHFIRAHMDLVLQGLVQRPRETGPASVPAQAAS